MPRRPPTLSEAYLRREARRYLERWWPTEQRMREVLLRRVRTCVGHGTGTLEEGQALVRLVVADLVERGVLDDRRYAEALTEELHRKGTSGRKMRAKLREKGVSGALADEVLRAFDRDHEGPDPELERAVAYVRRRRLGPLRLDPEKRKARRERDLAAVARAGFPFQVALRVIDARDLDALLGD